MSKALEACGCFPTGRHYAGIAHLMKAHSAGVAEELAADPVYMNRPAAETGLDDVDFWVGGLAERTMVFGGMLGSTFNHVFETQAELLQNADRFYYLTRNQGLNFLAQLEGNSFSELIQRNTTVQGVPLDIFAFPGATIYLDQLAGDPSTWPGGLPEGFTRTGDGLYAKGPLHLTLSPNACALDLDDDPPKAMAMVAGAGHMWMMEHPRLKGDRAPRKGADGLQTQFFQAEDVSLLVEEKAEGGHRSVHVTAMKN